MKSLPTMIENATNRVLAKRLRDHLREIEAQVTRLDKIFDRLGQEPKGTDCPAIDGLIKEADQVAGDIEDKQVLDAAVIGSTQAIEHYEISRYGTLIAWAQELGHDNLISLLNANLREEKAADRKLNTLAEAKVNRRATRTAAVRSTSSSKRSGTVRKRSRRGGR